MAQVGRLMACSRVREQPVQNVQDIWWIPDDGAVGAPVEVNSDRLVISHSCFGSVQMRTALTANTHSHSEIDVDFKNMSSGATNASGCKASSRSSSRRKSRATQFTTLKDSFAIGIA